MSNIPYEQEINDIFDAITEIDKQIMETQSKLNLLERRKALQNGEKLCWLYKHIVNYCL